MADTNYDEYFDEEGNFEMRFGDSQSAIELILRVNMDETVDIRIIRGNIDKNEYNELIGVVEDSMDMLEYDVHGFVTAIKDWLYYATGDEYFHDDSWRQKQKAYEEERQRKKAEKERRIEEEKIRAEKKRIEKQKALLRDVLARLNAREREHFLRMAREAKLQRARELEQQSLERMRDEAQKKAVMHLYLTLKLTRPEEYAGPDNYYFLDNLEINYGLGNQFFSHTFCQLRSVPPIIGAWTHLTELNLSYNELIALPNEIGKLVNLRRLFLSENKLRYLPLLGTLTQLETLDLRKNMLTELPPDIGTLSRLQQLDVEYNKLQQLPPDIGNLTRLDYLALNHNKLTFIPPQVGQLTNLEHFRLRFNPIKVPPPEVFHQGIERTLEFLRNYIPENAAVEQSSMREAWRKFCNSPQYSDVVLRSSDNEYFYVHKLVLYCRSSELYKMYDLLANQAKELQVEMDSDGRIIIPVESTADVLKHLVEFLYFDDFSREKDPSLEFEEKVDALKKTMRYVPKEVIDELEKEMRQKKDTLYNRMQRLAALAKVFQLPRLKALAEMTYSRETPPESTFTSDFKKLLFSETFSDVRVEAGGQSIPAHKLVLIARSKYFEGMLSSGLKEAQENLIHLSDLSFPVAKAVVEFCYTDDVEDISSEMAIDLLIAARLLGLERLRGIVESVVGYALDIENAACIYDVAALYSCDRLKKACAYFIIGNWTAVTASDAFKEMDEQNKNELIQLKGE